MQYANGDFRRLDTVAMELAGLQPKVIAAAPGESVIAPAFSGHGLAQLREAGALDRVAGEEEIADRGNRLALP